jgi:hypothetical protein
MDERNKVFATESTADPAPIGCDFPSDPKLQFNLTRCGERAKFLFVGELGRSSRAEEQSDRFVGHAECVVQHRPQRSDSSPSSDEEKSPLRGLCGKREGSERTIDIDERARFQS